MSHPLRLPSVRCRNLAAVVLVVLVLGGCALPFGSDDGDSADVSPVLPTASSAPGTRAPASDPSSESAATSEPTVPGVRIDEAVYAPTFPPPAGDGWTEKAWITYGSGGVVFDLPARTYGLAAPEGVAFTADQYVEVGYDQGSVSSADDARVGAACRLDEVSGTFYGMLIESVGAGSAPGLSSFRWRLQRAGPDGAETFAESDRTFEARPGLITVGLACTTHPDGVQLDVRVDDEWVGGTIDGDDPLSGTTPGVYVDTPTTDSIFRAPTFAVFETSRGS